MVEYFTEAYWDALAAKLNEDEGFQEDAAELTTDLLFVAKDKDRAFHVQVDQGKVTAQAVDPDTEATFRFAGAYDTWVKNHRDEAGLQKLIMTGKLQFKGSIPKIMALQKQLGAVTDKAREIEAEY